MDEQKFPENHVEYLTMLHMNDLDTSGLTPEQLVDKYLEVENAIAARFREIEYAKYPEL